MRCDHKCELFRLLVRGTTKLTSMAAVWLDRYRTITRTNQRETGLSPACPSLLSAALSTSQLHRERTENMEAN